jgi:hypothetical protein
MLYTELYLSKVHLVKLPNVAVFENRAFKKLIEVK